jgi:PTS system nitrogen regulatory IIA component
LDRRQAARYLGISEEMLGRWVRQGLLPGAGPDGNSFDPQVLMHWAEKRGIKPHPEPPQHPHPVSNPLVDAIRRGAVVPTSGLSNTSDAITAGVEALPGLKDEVRAELLEQALERERMATTGMGHGIAMPHPRKPPGHLIDQSAVAVVYCNPPLDWAAVDREAVHTAFLLVSPNSSVHVKILSRLAQAVRSPGFLPFLMTRPEREELLEYVLNTGEGEE